MDYELNEGIKSAIIALGGSVYSPPARISPQRASQIECNEATLPLSEHHEPIRYSPLTTTTSFRILEVLSIPGSSILNSILTEADINSDATLKFVALSYTWENRDGLYRPILVNGAFFFT